MDKEVEVIDIYDKQYIIVKEVLHNDISYFFLSNVNDSDDTMIRKSDKNDKDLIVPLSGDDEYELACLLFSRQFGIKNKNDK